MGAMNDVEGELRSRFARTEARLVGSHFAPLQAPAELLRRTHRRQATTVVAGLAVVAAVAVASVAGAAALLRSSERRVPIKPPDPFGAGAIESAAAQPGSLSGIVADTAGNLWSTTPALTRFDPRTGTFRTFTVVEDPAFGGVVQVLPARAGGVWILSPGHGGVQTVRRFDSEGFPASSPSTSYVSEIAEAPDGTIWASGLDVRSWNGGDWVLAPTDGLPMGTETGAIAVDADGNVWVELIRYPGPDGRGVARFDGAVWTTYASADVFPLGSGGPDAGRIWTIVPGSDGDVWVGGAGTVSHFVDGGWTSYRSEELGLRNVMSIVVANGAVWAGGEATGSPAIIRFDGVAWVSVSDGLEGDGGTEYTQLAAAPDGLWATTNTGLFRLDGSRWTRAGGDPRPSDVMPPIAAAGPDELWTGDWTALGGIWHLQGDRWTHVGEPDGLPGGRLHDLAVGGDTLWAATKHGLASFDGVTWERVASGEHWAIAVAPDGQVWTASGALGEGWIVSSVGGEPLPILTEVETSTITDLAIGPTGDVWAGSAGWYGLGGGLAHFDGTSWERVELVEGVDDLLVHDIELTPDGDVWIAAEVGSEMPSGGFVARFHDGVWTTSLEDALALSGGIWSDPLAVTGDGRLLAAGAEGLLELREGTWSVVREGIFPLGWTAMLSVAPDGSVWVAGDGLFRLPTS